MTTFRRVRPMPKLKPGDVVIRRHRLLKTHGTVVRYDGQDDNGASRAWIRWDHATTLPNPSLETLDDVELVEGDGRVIRQLREHALEIVALRGHSDACSTIVAAPAMSGD